MNQTLEQIIIHAQARGWMLTLGGPVNPNTILVAKDEHQYQGESHAKALATMQAVDAAGEWPITHQNHLLEPVEEPWACEQPGNSPETAQGFLLSATDTIAARGKDYDKDGQERSFAATAQAFNAVTGSDLTGSDVALILIQLKLVRQYSDPSRLHVDSLLDLVSYSALWAETLTEEFNQ